MVEKKSVGITSKIKEAKNIAYKPYALANKYLSKADYVAKQDKEKARRKKLIAYNAKLLKEENEEVDVVEAPVKVEKLNSNTKVNTKK